MPDVVRFSNWLELEGLKDRAYVLDESVSWTQLSAAVFYADMTLKVLTPETLLTLLADGAPIHAMMRRQSQLVPPGVQARVIDSGREYDLLELSLPR